MQTLCFLSLSDVYILSEVFTQFAADIYKWAELDVFQYVSLPGVSFDIFLKTTGARIEKITSIDVLRYAQVI